ncbi:cell cycle progression protein 1 isoform X3 [Nerophis ophidion]|uniref:cell cycle progression protein 1 isoform X3 n=1 Tax=Nerophis ophidion TaxID=159077 RepID=UPI002ADFCD3E|nr:cell cycle progression protein 1 isoform X3 [Nerophis ophidion]
MTSEIMSDTGSDTESSCGWSIISFEGSSDIETLVSEAVEQHGDTPVEGLPVVKAELQDPLASASASEYNKDKLDGSLNDTIEQTIDETLYASETVDAAVEDHGTVLSSSDHSDIVTLQCIEEEAAVKAANEESYLGMSCSSQYSFTASESGLRSSYWNLKQVLVTLGCLLQSHLTRAFPPHPPHGDTISSSSSEDEEEWCTLVRRLRLRKNATSMAQPFEVEETKVKSGRSEKDEKVEEEKQMAKQSESRTAALRSQASGTLNTCILLALVIAISMGLGHFYGSGQVQENLKTADRLNDMDSVRDLLQYHVKSTNLGLDDLDDQNVISLLANVVEKISKENNDLSIQQRHVEAQRDGLAILLRQKEEKSNILIATNQQLKSSLQREEKTLSSLREKLSSLRSRVRDLEAKGAGADSLLSENQRLKDELEGEKELVRNLQSNSVDIVAEELALKNKLKKERKVTEKLRRKISELRSNSDLGKAGDAEAMELKSRLKEAEKKLGFEQQRSDLWERLYLETKEGQAKGDSEPTLTSPKLVISKKVKETFDAVKNSTKKFVHHHKEQLKKAEEAVKENLRKISDSVKSTFRHFKDSASTFINKAKAFYECNNNKKCQHKHDQTNHNTRKQGGRVHKERGGQNANLKGCQGVLNCAYQESMGLFNMPTEPIRADEFHQLLWSYLQQEVDHFYHWEELGSFISNFFHNGYFIHDRMRFTDFVSKVEAYLLDLHEYHGLDDVFGNLDDFIYRHFFGEGYAKNYGPSGPLERPDSREESRATHQARKQQRDRARPHSERRWSRTGKNGHMADVKIELGPMPFDPKY